MTINIRQVEVRCQNCFYRFRYPCTQPPPYLCSWCGESFAIIETPWQALKRRVLLALGRTA